MIVINIIYYLILIIIYKLNFIQEIIKPLNFHKNQLFCNIFLKYIELIQNIECYKFFAQEVSIDKRYPKILFEYIKLYNFTKIFCNVLG